MNTSDYYIHWSRNEYSLIGSLTHLTRELLFFRQPSNSEFKNFVGNHPDAWRTFINKPYLQEMANAGKTVSVDENLE